jgi:hypothetical protein
MKLSNFVVAVAIAGASFSSAAVFAKAAAPAASQPSFAAGAVVYDPQGGEVGRIASVAADTVVVDTGTNKATLPKSAFASSAKGPTINATKAQLDQLVTASLAKADAALDAALVPGTQVHGKAGAVIGTVKEVSGEQVVLDRIEGGPVSLNKAVFVTGASGLSISLTADELQAAAAQATSAASATTTAETSS